MLDISLEQKLVTGDKGWHFNASILGHSVGSTAQEEMEPRHPTGGTQQIQMCSLRAQCQVPELPGSSSQVAGGRHEAAAIGKMAGALRLSRPSSGLGRKFLVGAGMYLSLSLSQLLFFVSYFSLNQNFQSPRLLLDFFFCSKNPKTHRLKFSKAVYTGLMSEIYQHSPTDG